ncbi:MAG: COX15/CtaA family protein, partial [bacterium]|nr:COX15/CtaA family protein [bacterium]
MRAPTGTCTPVVRGVFIANLVVQVGIVVTGAVVRLTGSGLGCPTWPECVEGSYVPLSRQEESWHKYVEFGNRMLTFVLVIAAIAAIGAAFWDRRARRASGLPSRPVVVVLAFIPFVGTFAQAILGGITVRTGLHPATVSAHFLLSMALIAGCVVLVVRASDAGDRPIAHLVPSAVRWLAYSLLAVSALVVVLGVLVTGSGPHSGDAKSENRYPFDPRTISWLHADVVLLFLGLTIGLLVLLYVINGPAAAITRTWILLGVAVLQGIVGYTQYFAGLPAVLVTIHVLGAGLVWVAVLFIPGGLRTRGVVNS